MLTNGGYVLGSGDILLRYSKANQGAEGEAESRAERGTGRYNSCRIAIQPYSAR